MLRRTLMSALAFVLFALPAAAQSAKNPELQKIADAFVAAWNKGDAKALTALHAENCIRADSSGQTLAGRAAIEEGFTKAFAGPLKGTKLVVTPADERTITPDLAVTSGTWEITGGTPPPGGASKGTYINTMVKQGGKWLIASSAPIPAPAKP
jgi:uncharacterized protein (TIGR02246 family)